MSYVFPQGEVERLNQSCCCMLCLFLQHVFMCLYHVTLAYFLLLYLRLDHFELCRRRFLIGHKLLGVSQPAEQRLQCILEPPTVQQGFVQLG